MESLPVEIRYNILLQADLDTLDSLCKSDRTNYSICKDKRFWTDKIRSEYIISKDLERFISIDPYFLYQFLSVTSGNCGQSVKSFFYEDCLYGVGRAGRPYMIDFYIKNLGHKYKGEYRALINGALNGGHINVVFRILDVIDKNVYGNVDPLLDVFKLLMSADIQYTIATVQRYPDLNNNIIPILLLAIDNHRFDIVRYLTTYEPFIPIIINNSYKLLVRALYSGDQQTIQYLMDMFSSELRDYPDNYKRTLISLANERPNETFDLAQDLQRIFNGD